MVCKAHITLLENPSDAFSISLYIGKWFGQGFVAVK